MKSSLQLDVALPATIDFQGLALSLSKDLPRDPRLAARDPKAARAKLADLVKFKTQAIAAQRTGSEMRGDVQATYWKLRIGDSWTVPAVELVRGNPKDTVLLVADSGRKGAVAEVEALLAGGQRVVALDPFYLGESAIAKTCFASGFSRHSTCRS